MIILYAMLFFCVNISAMVQQQQKIAVKLNFTLQSKAIMQEQECIVTFLIEEKNTETSFKRILKFFTVQDPVTQEPKITYMNSINEQGSGHNHEIFVRILNKAIKKHYDPSIDAIVTQEIAWSEKPVEEILAINDQNYHFSLADLPDEEETFLKVQPVKKQEAKSSWCTIL